MKKQQWLFKQVFSMINSSSSTTTTSFNIVRPRRPFCSALATITTTTTTTNNKQQTTNKSLFAAAPATVVAPPVSNNKQQEQEQEQQLNILLEKKLPLLIVPYDHVTQPKDVKCPSRNLDGGGFVCDGTLGFISLFHKKEDDDQLIINKKKKKKKKKEVEVYEVHLPEIAKRRIYGSSEGWLVTIHENGEVQLLNPVTRAIVHLPPLTAFPGVTAEFVSDDGEDDDTRRRLFYRISSRTETLISSYEFREYSVQKVVTNTSNSTTLRPAATMVVMAIYDHWKDLAFCRTSFNSSTGNGIDDGTTTDDEPAAAVAAKRWIKIPTVDDDNGRDAWVDITFYKGNFYAVGPYGYVGVVKGLDGPSPFVQIILHEPEDGPGCFLSINYLVESSSSSGGTGDLLMIMRDRTYDKVVEEEEEETDEEIFEHPSYRTIGFKVLKLDLNNGPPSWEEVTDLGEDCALFVGYNHSFSFSASKVPGCSGNCIYFTDNHPESIFINPTGGHDIGVYNLGDSSFEKLNYETSSSQLFMPPPVWYVPN